MYKDNNLIHLAKTGNQEAFGQLVQQHRTRAVVWAREITNDSYLAEDVVQDSIIRSFLHLEKLDDPNRFLPWFRQIVRNKAIDYIRKESKHIYVADDVIQQGFDDSESPEELLEYKEWLKSFRKLSSTLSTRDQQVFESHFLRQVPPDQIACTYGMKTSNVYNIISRSKVKLQDERFKQEVIQFTQGWNTKRRLEPPRSQSIYTSLGHTLFDILPYITNNAFNLSEVLGFTGQAFRTQVTKDIGLSSTLIYDWDWVVRRIASTFHLDVYTVGKPGRVPTPERLREALVSIHAAIDEGIPAIVWNLSTSEFGVIYGYDVENSVFTYRNTTFDDLKIPYEKLSRTTNNPELFVATFKKADGNPKKEKTIQHLIDHAVGSEPKVAGYITGLAAYDHWIEAFEDNRVNTIGHAYQVALLTEAREHAVTFLGQIPETAEARDYFQKSYEIYQRLYPSFPYGLPGVDMDIKEHSIECLKEIKELEEFAYESLKNCLKS